MAKQPPRQLDGFFARLGKHDLRHTALTHEAAAGNPMAYVQLKAGHSQGAITERYIHAAQVHFPGAAARAEQRMFSAAGELA
jgi:integrase